MFLADEPSRLLSLSNPRHGLGLALSVAIVLKLFQFHPVLRCLIHRIGVSLRENVQFISQFLPRDVRITHLFRAHIMIQGQVCTTARGPSCTSSVVLRPHDKHGRRGLARLISG